MPKAKGYLVKVGVAKSTTWGTAVSCNVANRGISIVSESLTVSTNFLNDESLTGTAFQGKGLTSNTTIQGTIEDNMQYSSPVLSTLIAMCMGRADTPIIVDGIDSASAKPYPYYGSYRLGDDLEGYHFSFCVDKQASGEIHEYDNCKVNSMTISGAAGDFIKISFDVIARKLVLPGIVTTTLSAATISTPKEAIRFDDLQFRVSTQASAAMDQSDQIYPTSFSITVNNNLAGQLTSLNSPYTDEPLRSSSGEITGNFEIPVNDSTTIEKNMLDGDIMKLDIRARSTNQINPAGQGPYYYAFEMFMPLVQIVTADRPVSGFGLVPSGFSFTCKKADSAPNGMNGSGSLETLNNDEAKGSITEPLRIEVTNLEKENPLA